MKMTKQVRAREWARKEVEFWTDSSGHLTQTPQEMAERGWKAGFEAGRREAAAARRQAAHPAAVHCDNCGCDWLDNGINPIGCPYCKQPAAVDDVVVERIAALLHEETTGEPWTVAGVEHPGPDRDYYRGLARKVAALAAHRKQGDEQ